MATQLDPQIVNLTKAIRQTESGGNFQATGKSGEYGAYQFTQPTWDSLSQKYLGQKVDLKSATPEQQNEVAYKQIADWKAAGNNVGQVASMWNAGQGEPNAYTGTFSNGKPSTGTNSYGVKFDVPAYAKSVATAYQTLKSGGNVGIDPNNPSSTAAPQAPQSPSLSGFIGNVFNSGANVLGGIGQAIMHPIKTLQGIGDIAQGTVENASNLALGTKFNDQSTQTASGVADYFGKRYGGSNPMQVAHNIIHSAYTDPVGVALDLSTLLTGAGAAVGGIGKLADISTLAKVGDLANVAKVGETTETLNNISKVGNVLSKAGEITNPLAPIAKVGGMIASGVGKVAGESLGISTGAGFGSIKEGLNAVTQGGEASKSFLEGLRGTATPEEIVSQAKDALGEVMRSRSTEYQSQLAKIAGDTTTYDISPILKEVQNQLERFKVSQGADGLDFSRSKFALDTTAQRDISNLVDYVKSYGSKAGDRTAVGIDNLKKIVSGYFSPNSDYRAFTQGIKSSIWNPSTKGGVLGKVPGYAKLTGDYEAKTGMIEDIQRGLSLGDKAQVETSFKKLTSALRQNNEYRKAFVQELDAATNGQLLPRVAGQQLNSIAPRGLARLGAEGGGVLGIVHGFSLPLLFSLAGTSPRLVGELISALGMGLKASNNLIDFINTKLPNVKIPLLNAAKIANESESKSASKK